MKIKELICQNITDENPVDEFICSNCGFETEEFYERVTDKDDGSVTHFEFEIRYCPKCGAKVVEVMEDANH